VKEFVLNLENISINISKKRVLDNVNFTLINGEIHSLAGLKDAGKTTIVKIIGGLYPAGTYEGKLFIRGAEKKFHSVKESEKAGVAILYQNAQLIKSMTVCENIFLANEIAHSGFIDWQKTFKETSRLLIKVGLDISPATKIAELDRWEQLLVNLAKALSKNPHIMIFDEPTAALSELESKSFLEIIRKLNKDGYSIIFNTSRLNEIFDIADRITILRDGRTEMTEKVKNLNSDTLLMYIEDPYIQHLSKTGVKNQMELAYLIKGKKKSSRNESGHIYNILRKCD
jgi:D-xylose transport system ATP-binding protein